MDAQTQIRIHVALHPQEARHIVETLYAALAAVPQVLDESNNPVKDVSPLITDDNERATAENFCAMLQSRVTEVNGIRSV